MRWGFYSNRELFENLGPDDIVIAVIGPTGAGKSSFINTAADERLEASGDWLPCTKEFAYVRCTFEDSRELVFVDTPAFLDPYSGNDLSAGTRIRGWLREAFRKRIKVTGILYLHHLAQNRSTEPLPPYQTFRKLCGNLYPKSSVLVLTKCEKLNPTTCQKRRKYLTTHWKKKMGENARVCSHYGTVKSAWDVVAALGVEAGFPNNITEFYRKKKLDTQSFHSTTLPKLQASVYSALTTFESGISPWMHPSEWLDSNTKHIRSVFDGIVDCTENAYIKKIPFPSTRIFQRLSLYIFAHNILCARNKRLLGKLNATLKKCQDRDMPNLMRNQANVKNELLDLFRNVSAVDDEMQCEDLLRKLLVLDSVALSANIELLLADKETFEELVETKGAGAQSLVNVLHARLDFPMDSANKVLLVRALTRLSERSGLYPESLTLTNVTPERGRRATGGSADVYKGICLGEDIALKVFKIPLPSGVNSLNSWRSSDDRFQGLFHEVITWRQLSHPNVLPFYGVHFLEDPLEIRFCLVSPWMENGNVVEFLAHRNRMAPYTDTTDCVSLALDIAHGVQYLHSEKVIHRDLKGYNILISPSTRAFIADFGLATLTDSGSGTTLVGSAIMGTPKWLAPELIPHEEVKRHHTFASDIYAFALVCYEMFSGKVPFEHVAIYGLIPLLQKGERPSLPTDDLSRRRGLTPEMGDLIQDCWNQEPTKRPSADKIVERLQFLRNHQDDQRPPSEIGTSFFTQLLSNQVDNPFAILSMDHAFGVRA